MKEIDHEVSRRLLSLAAAGGLDPRDLRAVEQHAAACPECRRELSVLRLYADGLQNMPQPLVPSGLLQRTVARVIREQETRAERLRQNWTLGRLTAFSWAFEAGFWLLAHTVAAGELKIFGADLTGLMPWSLASALLTWTTAGVMVLFLGKRKSLRSVL